MVTSVVFSSLFLQLLSGSKSVLTPNLADGYSYTSNFGYLVTKASITPELNVLWVKNLLFIFILSLPVFWYYFYKKEKALSSFVFSLTVALISLTSFAFASNWFGQTEWQDMIVFVSFVISLIVVFIEFVTIHILLRNKKGS